MKSITAFSISVILVFAAFPAAGESKAARPYAFSLGAEAGALYGVSREILYDNPDGSRRLSELAWNIRPLWFAGLSAGYGPRDPLKQSALYAELGIRAGLPLVSGRMEDRDWYPVVRPLMGPGPLTHFSAHENRVQTAVLADLKGGLSWPLGRGFFFRLNLGVSYMFFSFEAWNGYVQYGSNPGSTNQICDPWDPSFPKVAVSGRGIGYAQHWLLLSQGFSLDFAAARFSASLSLSMSPLIACYASDLHYAQNPPFQTGEYISGGIFAEPAGNFFFMFSASTGLGFSVSYRFIGGSRGYLIQEDFAPGGTVRTKRGYLAGAAYSALSGSAVFKIKL